MMRPDGWAATKRKARRRALRDWIEMAAILAGAAALALLGGPA